MTKIIQQGKSFIITEGSEILDRLPKGNYILQYSQLSGFYLDKQDDIVLPNKIYGDPEEFCARVLKTYKTLDESTGVYLSGLKGTGKSITAKLLAVRSEMPVINIVEDYSELRDFKSFMSGLNFECIVMIDEFEKLYPKEEQQNVFLSILDGNLSSKKLFVFTTNAKWMNQFLENRMKRVRYHKKYGSLPLETIEEIIEDNLLNKEFASDIKKCIQATGIATMDIVLSLIQEVNIHDCSPMKFVSEMNIATEDFTLDIYRNKQGNLCATGYSTSSCDLIMEPTCELDYISVKESEDDQEGYIRYKRGVDEINRISETQFTIKIKGTSLEYVLIKKTYGQVSSLIF